MTAEVCDSLGLKKCLRRGSKVDDKVSSPKRIYPDKKAFSCNKCSFSTFKEGRFKAHLDRHKNYSVHPIPDSSKGHSGRVHFQRPICDIFLTLKCCSFIKELIGIQKM